MRSLLAVCAACLLGPAAFAAASDCPGGTDCGSSPKPTGAETDDLSTNITYTCRPPRTSEPVLPASVTCEQLPKFLADSTPADDDTAPGRVARRMCRKHQLDHCALPKSDFPYLIDPAMASFADPLELPHMVLLGFGERDKARYACSGALVSPDYVLTAAHCTKMLDGKPVRWALLGATNRTSMSPKANDTRQLLEVAEVVLHPEYRPPARYHDIALLRLQRAAKLSLEDVKPACLNTDMDEDLVGKDAVAAGWELGDEGKVQKLAKANLTVRDLKYCEDRADFLLKNAPRGFHVDGHLCVGGNGQASVETCQVGLSDLLQIRTNPRTSDTCMHRLVGIRSFGQTSCGPDKPIIYTKVAEYVPWIEKTIWPVQPNGCASVSTSPNRKYYWAKDGMKVSVPYTGPGSIARGMCRVYHVDFCGGYDTPWEFVKPELSPDSKCHHNRPPTKWNDKTKWSEDEPRPLTVTLRYEDASDDIVHYNRHHDCGGALISPRAVLTAARCRALGCLQVSHVILGDPGSGSYRDKLAVQSVHVHPEYRAGRAHADLAVLLLAEPAELRRFIPSCLHTPADTAVRPGDRVKAAAWNIQGSWERVDFLLANTTLTVRSDGECRVSLLGEANGEANGEASIPKLHQALPDGFNASLLLCAGGMCDEEVYPGDSGVPLTARSHRLLSPHSVREGREGPGVFLVDRVLAVASSETHCSASRPEGPFLPDLFTRAASYVAWIESVVWPDEH